MRDGGGIDFRLDEPQWEELEVGDIIQYWEDFSGWDKAPAPNARRLNVKITDIFRVPTFQDLIARGKEDGFFRGEDAEDIITGLRRWWTPEREQKNGVLGLKVEVLDV